MNVRARLAVAATALAATLPALAVAAPPSPPAAVPGGTQVAFQPTRRTNIHAGVVENRPLASYRGPWLRLQVSAVSANGLEPTVGVGPDGTAYVAAGTSDVAGWTEVRRSSDGGRTWTSAESRVRPPQYTLEPSLHVDPLTGRVFVVDFTFGCTLVAVWDGGIWTDTAVCDPPYGGTPSVVSAPPPADMPSPVGYDRYVYLCFSNDVQSACHRSLDGGRTFLPPGQPASTSIELPDKCQFANGQAATDLSGRLLLPMAVCGEPWLSVSDDAGLTWRRSRVSDVASAGVVTSVAADTSGNLYYTWWDSRALLPYLAVSRDHGLTWDRPLLLAPPGVTAVAFPAIDAGLPGRVAVTFPGTTGRASDLKRPWNYYVLTSTDALSTMPTFVAATANPLRDPVFRGSCTQECGGMSHFLDVLVAPRGEVWATLSDTCTHEAACNDPEVRGAAVSDRVFAIRQVGGPRLR